MVKPAKLSRSTPRLLGAAFASGAAGRTPARSSAESRNATAEAAKTASTPTRASRIPPIAGPTKTPTLSIVVSTRFAAVSSSVVRESVGKSAACVGRKIDCISPTSAVNR